MRMPISGPALAFAALAPVSSATAQAAGEANAITVEAPLLHPSAGLMNEHMHDGGEVMIGLRFERTRSSGTNQAGSDEIADADIVAAGYTVRTASMEMDMAMLDLMYAPSDAITFMLMPHYMWHRMEMVGIDPMAEPMPGMDTGHEGHGGHGMSLGFGETHAHSTDGFGDTLVSASYRLARSDGFGAHATLGVWVPTGKVDRKNADGTFVHYGMQSGSGTWDVEPSLTVHGQDGAFGWGAQAGYRWRTETTNESGFSFGDIARATGWVSYLLGADFGATGRLEFRHEGKVEGHYNGPHSHNAPPDRQENYGGDEISAGLGVNWLVPIGGGEQRPQLSAEFAVPLYQNLNGIQAPEKWRLSFGLSREF